MRDQSPVNESRLINFYHEHIHEIKTTLSILACLFAHINFIYFFTLQAAHLRIAFLPIHGRSPPPPFAVRAEELFDFMADSHDSAVVSWVSTISVATHSLIACHALASLYIRKPPKPKKEPHISQTQLEDVAALSKLKYDKCCKRSLVLISFGVCIALSKLVVLQLGCASSVSEGGDAVSNTSRVRPQVKYVTSDTTDT